MHPSIIREGDSLIYTVSQSGFGCPLCPLFITESESVIHRHCGNHVANAVHFNGKIICRCNLSCRNGGHFHCPMCAATIIRKDTITTHLRECQNKSDQLTSVSLPTPSVPPSQPSSPEPHPAVLSSVSGEHSFSLPPSVLAIEMDHSYTTASPKTPAVAPAEPEEPDHPQSHPATTSEGPIVPEEQVTEDVPPTHLKCPHCPVVLYTRNLFLHIQRKHGKAQDITAQSHLQSTLVDQSNGLYAL